MGYSYDKRSDRCSDGPAMMPESMNEAPSVDRYYDPMMELAFAGGRGNAAVIDAMSALGRLSESDCNSVDADGSIQMLIGGEYTDDEGDKHTYGHAAARVVSGDGEMDRVYDFGRYGATRGN